jgi:hypothetical protein
MLRMPGHARGVRRLCLLVDIEGYSKLPHPEQLKVQARLRRLLDALIRGSGVRPSRCERQQKGDGELVILPSGIDESRVVPGLVAGLRDLLSADRGARRGGHRIRMRAALDQSVVHLSAEGYVGTAVVGTERVVNSDALRQALAAYDGDLVVAVSGPLYEDVLRHGWGGLDAADFREVTVRNPGKGFAAKVWTWPAAAAPPGASAGSGAVRSGLAAAAGGGVYAAGDYVRTGGFTAPPGGDHGDVPGHAEADHGGAHPAHVTADAPDDAYGQGHGQGYGPDDAYAPDGAYGREHAPGDAHGQDYDPGDGYEQGYAPGDGYEPGHTPGDDGFEPDFGPGHGLDAGYQDGAGFQDGGHDGFFEGL